jgi:hypothetical protein
MQRILLKTIQNAFYQNKFLSVSDTSRAPMTKLLVYEIRRHYYKKTKFGTRVAVFNINNFKCDAN